jgi:hypothetical protein
MTKLTTNTLYHFFSFFLSFFLFFLHHCTFKTPTFGWAFFIRALATVLRSDFVTDKLPFIYSNSAFGRIMIYKSAF